MHVRVDEGRFLSVNCGADERVVFDRRREKYHLLRGSAARLWDEIGHGGTFDVGPTGVDGEDPVAEVVAAGMVSVQPQNAPFRPITRRVWLTRTGKASAAVVLPLVATIVTPRLALGQVGGPSLEDEGDPPEVPGAEDE